MSTIYLFPGQGSQTVGMGADLFGDFTDLVEKADSILDYSITELCLEDPDNKLNLTQFTQPALFVVNSLMYMKKISETGSKPDFLAGHSLGEYTALFAAGAFDFETGVRLVQKRGELMGKATGGGMVAVIGLPADEVRNVLRGSGVDTVDVANFNSPSQTILSGPVDDLEKARSAFEAAGAKRYLPLKVSAAFHSRYMEEAAAAFASFLKGLSFSELSIPVISNVTAQPYAGDSVAENLARQITSSVRWQESIEYLLGRPDPQFTEIGPGNVLTRLTKQISDAHTSS